MTRRASSTPSPYAEMRAMALPEHSSASLSMPTRRGFLAGIIAACAAPVIVRSGLIMPIKPLRQLPARLLVVGAQVDWLTSHEWQTDFGTVKFATYEDARRYMESFEQNSDDYLGDLITNIEPAERPVFA